MAAALAAQEAARRQRRMEAEFARRRELRRAQLHAGTALAEHERHAFACAVACVECGFLELPAMGGDPLRTDVTAIVLPNHACPHCGRRVWLDLAEVASAAVLRDHERGAIELRRGAGLAALGMIASLGVAAVAVLGVLAGMEPFMMAATLAIALAIAAFMGRRVWIAITTPSRGAARWRAPARRWQLGESIGTGRVRGSAKQAPISGRVVIGWRVEVRYPGDRGDAFALVEQDCSGLAIDGVALACEPTLATAAVEVRADRPEAQQWLRSRGLDPHDVLQIRERVLLDDAEVTLHVDTRGAAPIVRDGPSRARTT